MERLVFRGMIVVPVERPVPPGVNPYYYNLGYYQGEGPGKGHHLYMGKNRWLLPTGELTSGQSFHRRMLTSLERGFWKIV